MNRKINIGLVGFGVVGQGLFEVLEKTPGLQVEIKTIVVKNKNKSRSIPPEHFSYDINSILNNPEINTVVELIDDAEAAFEIAKRAMQNGKAVVSANKKMISEHFKELLALQKKHAVPFLYEAAVCASIPVIRNLEEYYDNELLRSIEGIVNGSTNYILSKTASDGLSYAEALKQAQSLGYAESQPQLDTGGFDARFKLQILIAHAFGTVLKTEEIFHTGIDRLGELELRYAREKNLRIKLKARAYKNESGKLCAFVLPEFVRADDKFYQVNEVYNALQIEGCFADRQFFVGRGAGAYPTASAVLSDISALRYGYRYEYRKHGAGPVLESEKEVYLKVLVRHTNQDADILRKQFIQVDESYNSRISRISSCDEAYTIGVLSLANAREILSKSFERALILITVPDKTELDEMRWASEEIAWAE
ncbi:MAG TPA: homoserine dehydrogenase [Bacteroidia bacterium]|nr:homoserine dehydrogenase [Bacteroidia bacterium]